MLSSHSWWKWSLPTITSTSGLGPGQRLAERLDLAHPLVGERRPVVAGGRAGAVVERVVGRRDHRDELSHRGLLQSASGSYGSGGTGRLFRSTDRKMSIADRVAQLLGELPDQPGGAGQQREAAQQLQRQAEVGQRGAADAGAVERQRLPEHLRVHPADRGEQRQVRPEAAPPRVGDLESAAGCAGRRSLCTWWPRPGTNRRASRCAGTVAQGERRPSRRRRSAGRPPSAGQHVVQEPAAVLGDAEEPRAAAEQPGGERALHGVRRGQVGQPGRRSRSG